MIQSRSLRDPEKRERQQASRLGDDQRDAEGNGHADAHDERPPRLRPRLRTCAQASGVAKVAPAIHVLGDAQRHPDSGRTKPEVPVDVFSEVPADEWPRQRAHVDPHVEHRESSIPPRAAFGIEVCHDSR